MEEKERIINYVSEKFLTEGFQKTTMDEIARDLKISKKTIYKYYDSKEALVFSTADVLMNFVKTNMPPIINSDENTVEKLKKIINIILNLTLKISSKWLQDVSIHMPELWERIEKFRTKFLMDNISKLLTEGKKEGLLMDRPNEIVLQVIISTVQGVVTPTFLYKNNYSANEAGAVVFEIIIQGLVTKKGRKLLN